jgi:hypothetical protein
MMRGAKFAAMKQPVVKGKIWRADIVNGVGGSKLYASLWNGDGLENWVLVNLIENGRLKKVRQPDDTLAPSQAGSV